MVDIETMGVGPNAAIMQIGACYFDRLTGEIGRTFEINVDLSSSIASGAQIDASNVEFWLKQSEAARTAIVADPKITCYEALAEFNKFCQGAAYIWSHATFDFVILTNAMRRMNIKPMFGYKSARDIRTLTDLASLKRDEGVQIREGTHHTALADAKFQVAYCSACFRKLKGTI